MGMGFAPTWLHQVSPPPLLHKTTLTTAFSTVYIVPQGYEIYYVGPGIR